ncbi:acetoacetate decarboxylase family protein [Mycobacterium sp. pUA109]|uniref:acetoacetate decarboxylase family protein n=1 Tax=Mycobacterium sp. pUA109 TaxID=3238982 RepID=UPI00351B30AB
MATDRALMGIAPASQGVSTLSDGGTVSMPLLTYQARSMAALFTVSAAKAQALIPTRRLRPVRITPHRALALVQVMEYIDKSISPYREFAFGLPVQAGGIDVPGVSLTRWGQHSTNGVYITHLAVDNDEALKVGWEVLGFPKFRTSVGIHDDCGGEYVAEATADDELIFSLGVTKSASAARAHKRDFCCYTLSPVTNEVFRVPYQAEATATVKLGSRSARLHLGSHPVAGELRYLDLSSAPLCGVYIPQYALISNRPDATIVVPGWRDPRDIYRRLRAD